MINQLVSDRMKKVNLMIDNGFDSGWENSSIYDWGCMSNKEIDDRFEEFKKFCKVVVFNI